MFSTLAPAISQLIALSCLAVTCRVAVEAISRATGSDFGLGENMLGFRFLFSCTSSVLHYLNFGYCTGRILASPAASAASTRTFLQASRRSLFISSNQATLMWLSGRRPDAYKFSDLCVQNIVSCLFHFDRHRNFCHQRPE